MDNIVWHTNHPLLNNDYSNEYKAQLEKYKDNTTRCSTQSDLQDSKVRLNTLEKNFKTQSPGLLINHIKKTLRSRESLPHAICRLKEDNQDVFTFVSTIMILSKNPELLISIGPPNSNSHKRFIFQK